MTNVLVAVRARRNNTKQREGAKSFVENIPVQNSEQIQLESFKALLKQIVQSNPNLTFTQKQIAMERIDFATQGADWIVDMMRMCGYI